MTFFPAFAENLGTLGSKKEGGTLQQLEIPTTSQYFTSFQFFYALTYICFLFRPPPLSNLLLFIFLIL